MTFALANLVNKLDVKLSKISKQNSFFLPEKSDYVITNQLESIYIFNFHSTAFRHRLSDFTFLRQSFSGSINPKHFHLNLSPLLLLLLKRSTSHTFSVGSLNFPGKTKRKNFCFGTEMSEDKIYCTFYAIKLISRL